MNLLSFVPLFGATNSYVASRAAVLTESRMRWLLRGDQRRRFVESGALVRHANQWYANPDLLDAQLLRVAEECARRVAA
jgi:hypothetical protein